MALNKLRELDNSSIGVTIPHDDLKLDGLLNEEGELDGEHYIHIQRMDEGQWELDLVENL